MKNKAVFDENKIDKEYNREIETNKISKKKLSEDKDRITYRENSDILDRKNVIYDNKKNILNFRGVISILFGSGSSIFLFIPIKHTVINKGSISPIYLFIFIMGGLLALIGLYFGLLSRREKDKKHILSYIGIGINNILIICIVIIYLIGLVNL